MRQLALKYKIKNGGYDSQDQAGMVARAMLAWDQGYKDGVQWAVDMAGQFEIGALLRDKREGGGTSE